MNEQKPGDGILASGLERRKIEALLRDAEPKRMAALSASINLVAAVALVFGGKALLDGRLVQVSIAVVIAMVLWRTCNRLWRSLAIAAIAPAIGQNWGQTGFSSGWGAVPVETRIGDLFSNEGGARFTAWQSQGVYRGISYRLRENTIWYKRRYHQRRTVTHTLQIEISVPQPFSGSIEICPALGFMGKVDDVLRDLMQENKRKIPLDPTFDAVFDTIASAGAPADKLLTPEFRRAMLALAARHPRLHLEGKFEHGWFSLRLPVPHLVFSSASLRKPLPEMVEDADRLWWDLTVPHRLIEGLAGEHDGPLR
ncbi:hypothetical protein FPY71_17575 [Aureimonas fodinaquatilis]|uniref:DUF3137 domain-containing protein n=1 Tax=Aureimonas fodinaquatilis TaxID=2565783 RepID=A0A5B0DRG9_9HYPH|nr:hypothetical protein [Aureimonas fodinaquatilis]KAA0968140.1 hypothetical protein FPY71_17575 [Aureimonas fodinaquatilis]